MITLVGCGFLGSITAEEIAKRFFAFDERESFLLIDSDAFEERNAANQNVSLAQASAGLAKVGVVGDMLDTYDIEVDLQHARLTKENIASIIPKDTRLLIDAVDNIETRRLLWYYGQQHHIPILHLGVSQVGTGNVEWTIGDYDTWALSPMNTLGQRRKIESAENVPRELKPCELIAFRGLGLNVGIAAAKAVGLFYGFDPEKTLWFGGLPGDATTWDATNMGHSLRAIAVDRGGDVGYEAVPLADPHEHVEMTDEWPVWDDEDLMIPEPENANG